MSLVTRLELLDTAIGTPGSSQLNLELRIYAWELYLGRKWSLFSWYGDLLLQGRGFAINSVSVPALHVNAYSSAPISADRTAIDGLGFTGEPFASEDSDQFLVAVLSLNLDRIPSADNPFRVAISPVKKPVDVAGRIPLQTVAAWKGSDIPPSVSGDVATFIGTPSLEFSQLPIGTLAAEAAGNFPPIGTVGIIGSRIQNQVLKAQYTLDDPDGLGAIVFQWYSNGSAIVGATHETYVLAQADVGKKITVTASYTDGQGNRESLGSGSTEPIANIDDPASATLRVSGSPLEASSLAASLDSLFDPDGAATASFRWQEFKSGAWVNINGATSRSLSIPSDQSYVGKAIRVVATSLDETGGATDFFGQSQVIGNINDSPTGSVFVEGGFTQGQPLKAGHSLDDPDGIGSLSYVWQKSSSGSGVWSSIAGANSSLYVPSRSDIGQFIRVLVSYTDDMGSSESVASAPTAKAIEASGNIPPRGTVSIAGSGTQNQILKAQYTLDDPDGLGAIVFQWYSNGSAIVGATHETYVLAQADVGKKITVTASYTDGQGNRESLGSGSTEPIANIDDPASATLRVSGSPLEASSLAASLDSLFDPDGAATASFRWQEFKSGAWVNINGATSRSLSIPSDQSYVGKAIRVVATSLDETGGATDFFGQSQVIGNINDSPTGSVFVEGGFTQGQPLKAGHSLDDPDGIGSLSYVWQKSSSGSGVWSSIAGANSSLYVPSRSDIGQFIRVLVSYTDAMGSFESVASAPTAKSIQRDPITGWTLDIDGNGRLDPYRDGRLIMRFALGTFPGSALTSAAATAPDATRVKPDDVRQWLARGLAENSLDIDSNKKLEPLVDGLLASRFISGVNKSSEYVALLSGLGMQASAADVILARLQFLSV